MFVVVVVVVTVCMLLHLSALIALMRGLSMSSPRFPCPVFCIYLSVEACLSPSLPFAVFALRLVCCDNVCCSSLVLSITAGSRRFPAVNSQSIYVPFGLVNSKIISASMLCFGLVNENQRMLARTRGMRAGSTGKTMSVTSSLAINQARLNQTTRYI